MSDKELSQEQNDAIIETGHVLLTSCPGSGKTRVLINKIAYEKNILGENKKYVVAVTFTVRASEEIVRRLNFLGIDTKHIWTGTLHSFCLEWILRPYSCFLPELKNGFRIADEIYIEEMLSLLREKYELNQNEPLNMKWARNGNLLESNDTKKRLVNEYYSELKNQKLIDFELILSYSTKLLRNFPQIAKVLANIFSFIGIDEYQDTQDLLYFIISKIICAGNGKTKLFMVGDIDQAIYSSFGGVAKDIGEIKNEINGQNIEQKTLTGNYRSCQRVIDFYSKFQTRKIKINALGKNANETGIITLNKSIPSTDVPMEIARLIKLSVDANIPEDEICVLVPQWWLITSITKELRRLLPEAHFDASGLSPLSKNRNNLWYKISRLFLTQPNPKIYSTRYNWAIEIIQDFKEITRGDFPLEYDSARRFLKLINSIHSNERDGMANLADCFGQLLSFLNIEILKYPELFELQNRYYEYIKRRFNDQDRDFPQDIESFRKLFSEMSGIVISTYVGIKGEEYETVIAFGLLWGYIPHWNEIYDRNYDHLAASKKLLYVICSRAKTRLHLISETGRSTRNGTLLEINHLLEEIEFEFDDI